MANSNILKKTPKPVAADGRKRLVLALFRLGTLSLALIELVFDDSPQAYFSDNVIAIGAILYTGFKLIHPLRWYRSTLAGTALTTADVTVCALLVFVPQEIHTPFALYALNPVLTSALLFPASLTWLISGLTAVYYSANFFSFPITTYLKHLSSMYFPHLVALGLMAWLPYIINSNMLQSLQSRVISEERLRLGREIHDGLSQTIYGLRLEVQMLHRNITPSERLEERLASLQKLLDKAENEARGSIELLRSFRLDHPFLPQIEDSLRHLESESGINCRLEAPGGEPRLDDLVKLEVLHICEEALMNVARHSGARQVAVKVTSANGHLHMSIADNGCGIANDGLPNSHGLKVMKERAESLGGYFQVISSPGAGTEIHVEVPRKWFPELETIRE